MERRCPTIRTQKKSTLSCPTELPRRFNVRGPSEPEAGSYVYGRILLNSKVPDGFYKYAIDLNYQMWIGDTEAIVIYPDLPGMNDELKHSGLVPAGECVLAAGYIQIVEQNATLNCSSGHYMAYNPVSASYQQRFIMALTATVRCHGLSLGEIRTDHSIDCFSRSIH